jgi:mannose/fructose/N-acetylgalactosamine-specific phosphotransferase system component IIC
MTNRKDLPTLVLGLCFAGYLAIAMGYVAHDGLGLSRETIRYAAILSAALLGTLLALNYLSKKLQRAK